MFYEKLLISLIDVLWEAFDKPNICFMRKPEENLDYPNRMLWKDMISQIEFLWELL